MLFAATPNGTRLPVIDVSLPDFAVPTDRVEIDALEAQALAEERGRGPLQRFALRLILKAIARQSKLVAALQAADTGFLSGIATYVMKLGPANLMAPYNTEIDKRIAATPIVQAMRIRLAQVAGLLAQGLAPLLAGNTHPLVILEIAGGPSADALNALIDLNRQGLLAGRTAQIVDYDLDREGPGFAANMLAALQTGPLAGRDISLTLVPGNWSDTVALAKVLAGIPSEAIVAATSEGGLFEYGSDSDIVGVLNTLRSRIDVITGSVTRNAEINRLMRLHSRLKTIPRGLSRFAGLIAPAGYRVVQSHSAILSDQVLLTRS